MMASRIIHTIKSLLTMKRIHCLFIDMVTGEEVFLYRDCYGDEWMANFNYWSFRVKRGED